MKYELFIALRYLKSKRKQALISLVNTISIFGIALGVAALIISISLMTGFQEEIQNKILGATSHILIYPFESKYIYYWKDMVEKIKQIKGVKQVMPVIYEKGLLSGMSDTEGAVIKGIYINQEDLNSKNLNEFFGKIILGDAKKLFDDKEKPKILLGEGLAASIGAFEGDIVTLISMKGTLSPLGLIPKMKRLEVAGIFKYGMFEYDSSWAFLSLPVAQKLFNMQDGITLIEVKLFDIYKAEQIAEQINEMFKKQVIVDTWMNQNKSLFSAMKLEKIMLFITLTLIILVASFNIISNLVLMVMEKNKDIAILMSMGATRQSIMKVFIFQGLLIGIMVTGIGATVGLLISYLFDKYKIIHLPQDVYFISHLPFKIYATDVFLIIFIAMLISFLATLYPAKRASHISPAESFRYG